MTMPMSMIEKIVLAEGKPLYDVFENHIENGLTAVQIARLYNVDTRQVRYNLLKFELIELKPKPRYLSDRFTEKQILDKIIKAFENGITQAELARKLKVTPPTIGKWVKKSGLKRCDFMDKTINHKKLLDKHKSSKIW